MIPILGLIVGIIVGLLLPFEIPQAYASYVAIGILACLDSVFGGVRSKITDKFHFSIFISGFFGNAILAIILTYIGDRLGISIHMAAIVVFGSRLFQNFAFIRRFILNKFQKQDMI
jgi:small basic protein